MDRRTLLFVIALTLAMFGINIYFEQGRQEALRDWKKQNEAVVARKQQQLEDELTKNSENLSDLPLVDIYADENGAQWLSTGVQSNSSIFSLAWETDVPHTIYARQRGSQAAPEVYQLRFLPQEIGQLAIYQKNSSESVQIANLPDFGTFYLQLIIPAKTPDGLPRTALGKYVDGQLTIINDEINRLKDQDKQKIAALPDAIALMKTSSGWQPVAIFDSKSRTLLYLDEIPALQTLITKPSQAPAATTKSQSKEEKFYVIETPFQQLVFSNHGGALAEINLPFASETNKESVVKEIAFDREMVEKHPYNAHFPSRPYFTADSEGAIEEHKQGQLGGYYPLLRRDLIQSGNRKSTRVSPRFYGFNIVSEYPELAELVYEVTHFDNHSIVFEATQPNRRITKTFALESQGKSAPYTLDVTIKIEGDTRGLWLTSGIPEAEIVSGSPAPALKYRITRNRKAEVQNIDLPQGVFTVTTVYPDWLCNSNGFLGLIMDPVVKTDPGYRVERIAGTVVPSRLVELDPDSTRLKAQDIPGFMTLLPLKSSGGTMEFRIFAGPFSESILKGIDQTFSDLSTSYNPDYIACQSFHGWFSFISEPFAKFLFFLMKFFHWMTGSWGFSIILLTVALRLMLYPLNAWSSRSMIRMQQIAPEVAAIQEKHKKDPKKAQIEIMNLYRDKGVNPLSGCLPLLIQMPFLIGMFDLLKSTFELRGASFIPGWIDDLAAPDVLFSWNTPIFFIGNEFHLLPFILGIVMFLQQRLMSPLPKDPKLLTDQQRQQRAMGTIMSVVFTIMFYHFPSGLNIYWLSSMLLGMLQQWWTLRHIQKSPVQKVKTSVK